MDLTYSSSTSVNWLIYQALGAGNVLFNVLLFLCKKHGTLYYQNKSKKYSLEPAVEDHANSQQHAAAFTTELLSRDLTFEEEARKIQDTRDEVYYKTLLTKYWIAKEEIPKEKFTSLLAVLQQLHCRA